MVALCAASFSLNAQEAGNAPSPAPAALDLAPITVVGEASAIPQIAGSAAVISEHQIQQQTYTNPNRVLQQVPGVYVREEDGFGNFPNISLRGADGGRSSKVTVMEDGIMMAPAPYSDPAAYYSPRIGRMSSIEVLKGSSQVRYGPQTTGGVINYLSTPFIQLPEASPEPVATGAKSPGGKSGKGVQPMALPSTAGSASEGYLKSTYGSNHTFLNHVWWGHTQRSDAGTFGFLLEFFHNQSEGYRSIDKVGGDTGFTTYEPMLRMFWEPDTEMKQRFEARFGYTFFDADETYLGLADKDIAASPYRRYIASQYDNIRSDQFRYSLTHTIQVSDNVRIESSAYYNSFKRDWYKLDSVEDTEGEEIELASALGDTSSLGYDIVRGTAAGSWMIRSNDREYKAIGVQTRADISFNTGSLEHDLSIGARLHYDESSRFQRDDRVHLGEGGVNRGVSRGRQGEAGNRDVNVTAFSMYLEDSIKLGRLTVKPGIRWEHLEMEFTDRQEEGDLSRVKESGSGSLDAFAPGIGLVYELTDTWSVFGGYYRGISTPGPRDFLREGTDLEKSNGYEFGVRHYGSDLQVELMGFYTDFDNLIVRDSLGGAGNSTDDNGGSAEVAGVEFAVRYDPLAAGSSDWRLPLRASATYTHSETTSSSPSADAESIFSGGAKGSQLPYIPEFAASAGLGVEYRSFGLYLDATYVSEMYGTAKNTSSLRDANGDPDARYGKTDAALTLDLSVHYQITDNVRLIAGVSNLTGEESIVSRLPYGARSNQPRSYYGGVEIRF